MTLHTLPIVPVSVTPNAGAWVDPPVYLVLDDVITPVGQVTVGTVSPL
jgi:hypothetical protein